MADSDAENDAALSNQLVMQELSQVHYIASRIHERLPKHIELHDLVQAGVVGLLEAYKTFDHGKSVKFKTYAQFRIKGSILDTLRSLDWGSRGIRNKAREIAKARVRLQGALGRYPSTEELATEMGISITKLHDIETELDQLHLVGQQTAVASDDEDSYDLIESAPSSWDNPFELYSKAESMAPLIAAVGTLSDREQLVLSLYYQEELTMREVAQIVGIAVSRVCQIHSAALTKLKTQLSAPPLSVQVRSK
jgi:RNA polymerase sigma factor for flagellar operon FliA